MKNTLIQYKGGGYDGCFWEWNFSYYDADSQWHDIFSSGRQGCNNEADTIAMLKENTDTDVYTYNLTSDKDIAEFITENAVHNVKAVAEYLSNNSEYEILVPCDVCHNKVSTSEIQHTSYKGNGGIGIEMLGLVCDECHSIYACGYCGEYFDPDDKDGPMHQPMETQEECNKCKYCIDNE